MPPVYHYRARTREGRPAQGVIEAADHRSAQQQLSQQGMIPLELKVASATQGGRQNRGFESDFDVFLPSLRFLGSRVAPIKLEEILIFTQQLQIAYSVGIPLSLGLEMIAEQTRNGRLRKALQQATRDLNSGRFLGDAIGKHDAIFDPVYIALIKAGEASGQLDAFLLRITFLLERQADLKAKVKSALFYPKLVLVVMLGATLLFVYVIIPKLKEFLSRLGADLPPITQAVLATSDFALEYWPLLALGGISAFAGFHFALRSPTFRAEWDRLLLRLPAVGKLLLQSDLNSFCFIMELLLKSGIPIPEALKIVKHSIQNRSIAGELTPAEATIAQGGTLAQGLKKSPEFPEMFVNLVSMGEESGRLEPVLGKIGEYYRREIDYRLTNLSKLIEPILLFIIFIGVGILALAVMLPIWKMSASVRR